MGSVRQQPPIQGGCWRPPVKAARSETTHARRRILAAIIAAGALSATGCGKDSTGADSQPRAVAGNGVDRAFVAEMVPHHQAAIDMAAVAQDRGRSTFVTRLAAAILKTQAAEITTLRREDAGLDRAGIGVGSLGVPAHMMGMDHDPATLKRAEPFDAAFLSMMVPHHEGAIEMAKAELATGRAPELKVLARDIIAVQRREIAAMRMRLGALKR